MDLIMKNPKITLSDLSKLTGLSRQGIDWNIRQLKSAGRIERIGPDKGGHWKVNN